MFERFTEKAIKVIMLAQEEARRLGHNFVGTEQVLLGLIGEGTGVAAKALKSMGVNLKDARAEVEKIIGRGSGFVAVEIPFTPRAKEPQFCNSCSSSYSLGLVFLLYKVSSLTGSILHMSFLVLDGLIFLALNHTSDRIYTVPTSTNASH